jgi:hypothetical protein
MKNDCKKLVVYTKLIKIMELNVELKLHSKYFENCVYTAFTLNRNTKVSAYYCQRYFAFCI